MNNNVWSGENFSFFIIFDWFTCHFKILSTLPSGSIMLLYAVQFIVCYVTVLCAKFGDTFTHILGDSNNLPF